MAALRTGVRSRARRKQAARLPLCRWRNVHVDASRDGNGAGAILCCHSRRARGHALLPSAEAERAVQAAQPVSDGGELLPDGAVCRAVDSDDMEEWAVLCDLSQGWRLD